MVGYTCYIDKLFQDKERKFCEEHIEIIGEKAIVLLRNGLDINFKNLVAINKNNLISEPIDEDIILEDIIIEKMCKLLH